MGESIRVVPPISPVLAQNVTYAPARKVSLPDIAQWVTQTIGLSVDTSEVQNNASSEEQSQENSAGGNQNKMTGHSPMMLPLPSPFLNASLANTMSTMSLAYEGPLSGLLDIAANKMGVWWKFDDGKVHFYRSVTRTIYIPSIGRKYKSSNSITSASSSSSGSSTTGSASAGDSGSGGFTSTSDYAVDIWADLEKTGKAVAGMSAGRGAQVIANASTGSITVTGSPVQVRNVEEWVRGLSDNLSQQVAITVTVYSITRHNEDNYQWDPTVIFKKLSSTYGFALSGPQAPAMISGKEPFNLSANVLNSTTATSQWSGSELAFKALSTLGDVSETINQSVVTLNGQPVPMQVASQITYLAQRATTIAPNVGATTALTPGTITTGFTAMFLPRIVNGKVLLNMNLVKSKLDGMEFAGDNTASIQTPKVSSSRFEHSVSLSPGDALMLSGLEKDNGETNRSGVGSANNQLLGGGVGATTGKKLIAIVITAKVL
jgi:type IVB pilus formation R64 PilN family outer membrane protein